MERKIKFSSYLRHNIVCELSYINAHALIEMKLYDKYIDTFIKSLTTFFQYCGVEIKENEKISVEKLNFFLEDRISITCKKYNFINSSFPFSLTEEGFFFWDKVQTDIVNKYYQK